MPYAAPRIGAELHPLALPPSTAPALRQAPRRNRCATHFTLNGSEAAHVRLASNPTTVRRRRPKGSRPAGPRGRARDVGARHRRRLDAGRGRAPGAPARWLPRVLALPALRPYVLRASG